MDLGEPIPVITDTAFTSRRETTDAFGPISVDIKTGPIGRAKRV